jgi:hypothetical protein
MLLIIIRGGHDARVFLAQQMDDSRVAFMDRKPRKGCFSDMNNGVNLRSDEMFFSSS